MESLYITDLIDRDVLQKVQDAFSNMVGMAAITTDEEGHPVTEGSNFSDYCKKYIRQTKFGKARCESCDRYGAIKTHDNKRPTTYICHAGLIDFAAPIMANDQIVGSFTGGQVLVNPPDKETVKRVSEELGLNFDECWNEIQKITVTSKDRISHAADFLFTISNVLSEMALGKYNAIKANEEIERAAKMKTDFLANMSHEIRTPMNAVIGMAEMALRENIPNSARNYIRQIKSSGRALLGIINDILDFSKIEAGKMDIIPEEYDTMSTLNDVSNIIMTRLVHKDVLLDIDVNPNLPSKLYGDNLRIKQILINIANNAAKFTHKGHVVIKVDFEKIDEEKILLKVSVEDTGIGMKEEELQKIFESFSQLDSKRNRSEEGTGLGLAITQRLLNLMDGSISVKSEYGKGSTFSLTIPQTVANWESEMKIKSTKKKIALAIIPNEYMGEAFVRDSKRLGVETIRFASQIELGPILSAMRKKHGAESDIYLFVALPYLSPHLTETIRAHSDVVSIHIADFSSTAKVPVPAMKSVKLPLSCMNLAMLYNGENISFSQGEDQAETTDFTAPDATVLIVDDNAVNLTVAEGLLEPTRVKTVTATSGKDALRLAKAKKFDLILMDHMMPEMDGVEVTEKIRSEYPEYKDTPIIALTANAIGDAKEMFMKAGMNDFIAKPIEINTLLTKLKLWLPAEKILAGSADPAPVKKLNLSFNSQEETEKKKSLSLSDLDTATAIRLLGTEALFWKVLKEYYKAMESKARCLKSYFDAKDLPAYSIEIHALKSSSRQIGAMQLSEMAAELEKASKGGDLAYIQANHEKCLEKYLSYREIFAKCFPEENEIENVKKEEKPSAPEDLLLSVLSAIKESAQNLDTDAVEENCKKLTAYSYSQEESALLEKLLSASDNLDMDECISCCEDWEKELKLTHI